MSKTLISPELRERVRARLEDNPRDISHVRMSRFRGFSCPQMDIPPRIAPFWRDKKPLSRQDRHRYPDSNPDILSG